MKVFYLDEKAFFPALVFTPCYAVAEGPGFRILYLPGSGRILSKSPQNSRHYRQSAKYFILRNPGKQPDTVFRGVLSGLRHSLNSSLQTRAADFSELKQSGTFRLAVAGCCQSYVFRIEEKVHQPAAVASLKAFYFQRASMRLERAFAGPWSRAAGHPDTAVIIHPSAVSAGRKAGAIISVPGGWYDAGDYNKYMVNSGISTGTLLSAYEDFKSYFDKLHTNIPAMAKPVPDILNEILYNLRWMLSMQDPEDGGVYNKCTNAAFDPMIMPDCSQATPIRCSKRNRCHAGPGCCSGRGSPSFCALIKTNCLG